MQFMHRIILALVATFLLLAHAAPHHGDHASEAAAHSEFSEVLATSDAAAPDGLLALPLSVRSEGGGASDVDADTAADDGATSDADWRSLTLTGMSGFPKHWHVNILCETSAQSPDFWSIRGALMKLAQKAGSFCYQSNPFGSKCQTQAKYKEASIGICGAHSHGVYCEDLETVMGYIWYLCRKQFKAGEWRAGGQVKWDKGRMRGILH